MYNNTSIETYRHNKHNNIKNNFTSTNEKYYSQHTVGISISTFNVVIIQIYLII